MPRIQHSDFVIRIWFWFLVSGFGLPAYPPPMLLFRTTGDWPPERVRTTAAPDSRLRIPAVERIIDDTWAKATAVPGVHLFDGPMCRLESWTANPQLLTLALSTTSYKPFLGTNLHNPHLADQYGEKVLANPVGVSPALETADNYLLFGRRNASVAYYPNRIHPFAGALEPKDASDLFAALRRELHEELALTADEITQLSITGIADDQAIRQPEIIFRATTTRTRAQVESSVDRTEHHASFAVPATPDGVDQALAEYGAQMTPVAIAALLLWSRLRFGDAFFQARTRHHHYPPR